MTSSDPALPSLVRDALLNGVPNYGVRFIADLGFGFSYPGGPLTGRSAAAAPANNALVADVSETENGSITVLSGQTVGYAGGGIDFSALTDRGSFLNVPPSVANDIWTAYGGASQHFLVVAYVKFPVQTDWNASANAAPFFSFGTTGAGAGIPNMITVAQTGGYGFTAFRQTAGTTLAISTQNVNSGDFGQLAQISFWRNAAGTGLTMKTSRARTTVLGAVGADNAENFAGVTGEFGVSSNYWTTGLSGQTGAKNFRLYRVFVENLARSGRDPLTVLDADWAQVVARGAFS